jgi:hypothetical protein
MKKPKGMRKWQSELFLAVVLIFIVFAIGIVSGLLI